MNNNAVGLPSRTEEACPEYCSNFRIGLPILPVRYAVLDADSNLPGLGAAFEDPSLTGLGNGARYGLRLLRRGYVYVYNENYRTLEAYLVTRKGTLSKMLLGGPTPLDQEATFNCQWQEHWGPAACLTVPNYQVATKKIWICFSNVEWTLETCAAHQDSGENGAQLRRQHMVPFNVREWLATQRHVHAAPIETIDAHIAEFAVGGMAPSTISRAFEWSVTPPLDRAGTLSSLVKAGAHRLVPGMGLVLALPDPVGIAQDLNALIKYKLARFMAQDEREWKLTTSLTIQGIREACVRQELDRRRINRVARISLSSRPQTEAAVNALVRAVDEAGNFSDSEIEEARQDSWKRYQDEYDEQMRADFDVKFQRDLDALEDSTLKPLASALAVWLRNESMCAAFRCNFDPRVLDSGHSYVGVAWSMICGVTGYGAVADEMLRQMEAEFTDKDAIFKRALLLNSDVAAERVSQVATAGVDVNDVMFWKQSTDLFKDVYSGELKPDVMGAIRNDLAKLVHELTAALVRVLGDAGIVSQARRLKIMTALGWLAGKNFVALTFSGTAVEIETSLMKQLLERSPKLVETKRLKRTVQQRVDLELRQGSGSEISAAEKIPKKMKFNWVFFLDEDVAKTLGESRNTTQMMEKVRASTLNLQQFDQLADAQYRRYVFNPAYAQGGKTELALGVVALILESVALHQLPPASPSLKERERTWAESSVTAAKFGLTGSAVELVGETLRRTKWGAMQFSRHVSEANPFIGTRALAVATVGRLIGTVGGMISVYLDVQKGEDAFGREKTALGLYLFTSAAVGFIVSAGYFLGIVSGGIAFVAMLMLALVGLVVEEIQAMFCRNDLEIWLSRTKFGLAKAGRFNGLEEQRTAIAALAGEK